MMTPISVGFVFSLILIAPITCLLPVIQHLTPSEDSSSEVKVQLSITSLNFTSDISSGADILDLREKLRGIFDQHDTTVILKVAGEPKMKLVNSAAWLDPHFFYQRMGEGGQALNQMNVNQSSNYHPLCVYETVERKLSGVFDLCTGIQGYFVYNKTRVSIKTDLEHDGDVKHKVSRKSAGSTDEMLNTPIDIGGSMREPPLRQKRSRGTLYMAVYLIADYEFFHSVCNSNITECVEVLYIVMRPVCLAFKRKFDLQIYILGLEFWSEGNQVDELPNSRNYRNWTTFVKETDAVLDYVRGKRVPFDLILMYSNSKYVSVVRKFGTWRNHAEIYHICNRGGTISWIDDQDNKSRLSLATVRTITISLHGRSIRNNIWFNEDDKEFNADRCHCKDRRYARCMMSPDDQAVVEYAMTLYDWGKCNIALVEERLTNSEHNWCFKDHPGYDPGFARCGNGNLDYDEECEFSISVACCTLKCRKREGMQCAVGVCCDLSNCQRKTDNTICRAASADYCDKPDVCDGRNADCPDEKLCIHGGWNGWTQWGGCICPGNYNRRTRVCDNPPKSGGGMDCIGQGVGWKHTTSCGCPFTTESSGNTNNTGGPVSPGEGNSSAGANPDETRDNMVLNPELKLGGNGRNKYYSLIIAVLVFMILAVGAASGLAYYYIKRSKKKVGILTEVLKSEDTKKPEYEAPSKSAPSGSGPKRVPGQMTKSKRDRLPTAPKQPEEDKPIESKRLSKRSSKRSSRKKKMRAPDDENPADMAAAKKSAEPMNEKE